MDTSNLLQGEQIQYLLSEHYLLSIILSTSYV